MKRILPAALALWMFWIPLAQARVAIVVERDATTTGATTMMRADGYTQGQFQAQIAKSFIETYNPGSVDVYPVDMVKTQIVKGGVIAGRSYAAVIWAGGMAASNNSYHVSCASCSLTFITTAANNAVPTVPMIFMGQGLGSETGFSNGATCSTLCVGSGFDPGIQGPTYVGGRMHLVGSKKSWPMTVGTNPGQYSGDASGAHVTASGTFRVLMGTDYSNGHDGRVPPPSWRDSLYANGNAYAVAGSIYDQFTSPAYGMNVWIRYNSTTSSLVGGPPGAMPNVFVNPNTHHSSPIGGGDADPPDTRVQLDPVPIYVAIAWVDSLLGGAILGTSVEPAKLGVQISGGFRRGLKTSTGGFPPFDSVYVGYALDSLKTLGIPFAVGVDPDSIDTYASDKNLWMRGGAVHWALESNHGLGDTTAVDAVSGNASTAPASPRIIDPFGRFRTRAWVKPTTDTTDTSVASLLKKGRTLIEQRLRVGSESIDGILMASNSDFSPRNWNNGGGDSLAVAAVTAGFSGISQNAEDSLALSTSNRVGYGSNQRSHSGFMALSFPGFNSRGAALGNDYNLTGAEDPITSASGRGDDSATCVHQSKRSMFGLFSPYWEMSQKYSWLKNVSPAAMVSAAWMGEPGMHAAISPKSNIKTGTNLVRVTASGFGSNGITSSPAMPAYYQLKYLRYQVDAINQVAGREIIKFVYPDAIGPKDILRR